MILLANWRRIVFDTQYILCRGVFPGLDADQEVLDVTAPTTCSPVPDETARVARAAFPHGNLYLVMRDAFGAMFTDDDFAALFPRRGQPAEAPWRLALVLVMQYVEDLSDRQAADAVRSRIDWKYALLGAHGPRFR